MTRSPLRCRTSIIRSSALVQTSSSLFMCSDRSVATGVTSSKILFSPSFLRALLPKVKRQEIDRVLFICCLLMKRRAGICSDSVELSCNKFPESYDSRCFYDYKHPRMFVLGNFSWFLYGSGFAVCSVESCDSVCVCHDAHPKPPDKVPIQ